MIWINVPVAEAQKNDSVMTTKETDVKSRNYWSLIGAMLMSGCATIVGDATHTLPVASNPSGALIQITDEKGTEVFRGETPTTVTLQKSDGSYWGGKTYQVRLSKDGYEEQAVTVKAAANGWYIGGNLVFGGLIGWFIVDPLNGKMYNLSPKDINAALAQKTSGGTEKPNTLRFVLIDDVPPSLRSKLHAID